MALSSKKRKNLPILIAILILFVLILNFYKKEVRNFFYLISSPVQKSLWGLGDFVSDSFEAFRERENLKKKNEELKLKIEELSAQNAALSELKKENETLREALKIGLEKEFKLISGQIIGKDTSKDSLIINKGLEDGVLSGLAVITAKKTLAGRVGEVYQNFSQVLLISNEEISFDAKISGTDIYGVIKGRGKNKIIFDFVPQEKEIRTGDPVATAAMSGIFPEGLLVGEVAEIKKSDIEPFQQAAISPFFDIGELRTLFIISRL